MGPDPGLSWESEGDGRRAEREDSTPAGPYAPRESCFSRYGAASAQQVVQH